ncbi:site-specific integrase [Paraconexibacter antarcticus]|uniref:Site-specific integrase n=1 Tax=Paraconexibacter antarcticus TaxID=2949664 RepID=A0ABY5DPF4_9ACTN|nr:site-specific integrase [Paraconexibacter antarcticus]UTI63921.1 site-specific integrase [Paraconexibacter antarcticus]
MNTAASWAGAARTAPPTADDERTIVMLAEPTARNAARVRPPPPARVREDLRKLKKTGTPGIFKKGNTYIVVYRAAGRQRKEAADTLEEARALKRSRETDLDRGEFQPQAKVTLNAYANEWIDRYQGNGRRGFREGTRDEYRRLLDQYADKFFSPSLRLTDLTPLLLAQYVGWVADDKEQGKHLSDSSIRNVLNPTRAMLSTAVREGLIRYSPATGLVLPKRDQNQVTDEDEEEIRTFTRTQLRTFLQVVDKDHQLLFTTLATTGLRISEAIALRWRDLYLEADEPHLRVRRALVKGRVEPPKTKHGRRKVPLPADLVAQITHARQTLETAVQDDDLVFTTTQSRTAIDPDNMRRRVLNPATKKAGAAWAGYHAFRHTYASLMLARGANLLQLSRALGHHSPAFTLETYTHLLKGEHAPALDLALELADHDTKENRS